MNLKMKLLAIGAACGLSFNLAAEAPSESNVFFSPTATLVIDEAPGAAQNQTCTGDASDPATECWASYRAVLGATFKKVQRKGTWT